MARKNKKLCFENIEVIDAGAKGKSIAKAPDGKIIFLPNAVPGDIVDIQTFKKRKAYYEGKATKIHKLSEKRTTPKCEHFGTCGGCKWQHMDYKHQLIYKQNEVTNNLKRLGHLEFPEPISILGSKATYFYRNKMEFSFSANRWLSLEEINSEEEVIDKNALGFHIPGMWDKILDINKCWLQKAPSNAIRNEIKAFAITNNISFYNVREQRGLLRTLMIRTSSTGDLMVIVQFFEDDTDKRELLLNHLTKTFPEITSLQYIINAKANDTIYDQKVICYNGLDHIMEEMEGLRFKINAKSFYQTNSEQAFELYKITREFANFKGNEIVYDLYTGTGTIALFVSKFVKKVVGVEAVPDAILAAKENAQRNHITNAEFYTGDMKNVFNDTFIKQHGQPDVVITDPPRDGMHKDVVHQLLKLGANRIVYVSCNSATQARDLSLLDPVYKIVKSQAVDMFPNTHHVENVVLLEKRKIS